MQIISKLFKKDANIKPHSGFVRIAIFFLLLLSEILERYRIGSARNEQKTFQGKAGINFKVSFQPHFFTKEDTKLEETSRVSSNYRMYNVFDFMALLENKNSTEKLACILTAHFQFAIYMFHLSTDISAKVYKV